MANKKPNLHSVLILEDDLEVVSKLLLALRKIEPFLAPYGLDITVLSTCDAVEELVNEITDRNYAIILMDRDCKANGSFHVLDMKRFGLENIISISSTPAWNQAAQEIGVKHIIPKSFNQLDEFSTEVAEKVLKLLKASLDKSQAM